MTIQELECSLQGLQGALLKQATTWTKNKASAQNLVQDTFIKALRNKDKLKVDTLYGWLVTVMHHLYVNDITRSGKQINIDPEDLVRKAAAMGFYEDRTPETDLFFREMLHSIAELPELIRSSFELFVQGYKYEEIAERISVPVGTVKSRIFTARKILSKELEEE